MRKLKRALAAFFVELLLSDSKDREIVARTITEPTGGRCRTCGNKRRGCGR